MRASIGKQLSIFGQEQCLTKAEIEQPTWIESARERFLAALMTGPKTVDEVITSRPADLHPNAIGSMVGRLSREHKIACIGIREASSVSRKGGINRVWALDDGSWRIVADGPT